MPAIYPHGSTGTVHVWSFQYSKGIEQQIGYVLVPPTTEPEKLKILSNH